MSDYINHPYAFLKTCFSDEDAYHEATLCEWNRTIRKDLNRRALVKEQIRERQKLEIVDVIFNGPATIVFWRDGTKTVVKRAIGDPFSEDAGVALCIAKKMMGDSFHRVLRDAVKKGRMNRNEQWRKKL